MDAKTRFQTTIAAIRATQKPTIGQMIELYHLADALGFNYENSTIIYNLNLMAEAKLPKVQSTKLINDLGHKALKSRWIKAIQEHAEIEDLLVNDHKRNKEELSRIDQVETQLREIAWQA